MSNSPTEDVRIARLLIVDLSSISSQTVAINLSELEDLRVTVVGDVFCEAEAMTMIADDADALLLVTDACNDGLDLVRRAKSLYPDTKIMILAMDHAQEIFLESVRAGVDGYILSSSPHSRFSMILDWVISGKCAYDSAICSQTIKGLMTEDCKRPLNIPAHSTEIYELSYREREVLDLIVRGFTNKEIARKLDISISTTKTHISRIFRRLNVSSRRELLPKAIRLQKMFNLTEIMSD